MRPSQAATALLCVLCTLVSTAMASQSFAERWHEAKAGIASSARPSSYYEPANIKHICLQEADIGNCRTVGCKNTQECSGGGSCIDCATNLVFQ